MKFPRRDRSGERHCPDGVGPLVSQGAEEEAA